MATNGDPAGGAPSDDATFSVICAGVRRLRAFGVADAVYRPDWMPCQAHRCWLRRLPVH